MIAVSSVQPKIADNSPLNSTPNNWPKPFEVKELEKGGELFIVEVVAAKDSPEIESPQVIASPDAKPLSKPDSEAQTAIANWSPVHGW